MKRLVLLATLLLSMNAFACPAIEGVYSCIVDGDASFAYNEKWQFQPPYTYKVTNEEGIEEFIADGERHFIPDTEDFSNLSYLALCRANSLEFVLSGILLDRGEELGQFEAWSLFETTTEGFTVNTTSIFQGRSVQSQTICKVL